MATAADVPNVFDLVIGSNGYVCADLEDVEAEFGYTPTFVTRQNTQGDYGDNQQDFWLTYAQNDWSLGEGQRYQGRDDEGKRRFWTGSQIDPLSIPGQVSMRTAFTSVSLGGAPQAGCSGDAAYFWGASGGNLFTVSESAAITDRGAHGLGGNPRIYSAVTDDPASAIAYVSSLDGGSVGVRKWSAASGFATFSATKCSALAFLNNTLYGIDANGALVRFDTAGAATVVFTWQNASGAATPAITQLVPFGGKLVIVRMNVATELWLYDGTGVALIARLPSDFATYWTEELMGTLFLFGIEYGNFLRPAIYFYAQGTTGVLWRSLVKAQANTSPRGTKFGGKLVWNEDTSFGPRLLMYDAASGGFHCLLNSYSGTSGGLPINVVAGQRLLVAYEKTGNNVKYHPTAAAPSSAFVTSSLDDFDSSLDKLFRGIKVDFDLATDGNGGSVDIAYRVGDVDGSYTSLVTGAVSGVENLLTNITGRSISIKITLNKGTSTAGPVLKRISVRAAPQQATFRRETYILLLGGRKDVDPSKLNQLRDTSRHSKDGADMAADLRTAATSATPLTITDEFGTFTGIIEADGFKLQRIRSREYLATVPIREV